jgi:hypothetical protein
MFALLIPVLPVAVVVFVASFFMRNRANAILLRVASGLIIAVFGAAVLLFIYQSRVDPYF